MKRLWFSAIFMLAALSLCFGEQIYISRDCREIIAAISEAEECESTPEKLKYCAEIYDMWSDYHKKASYVIPCCKARKFPWARLKACRPIQAQKA